VAPDVRPPVISGWVLGGARWLPDVFWLYKVAQNKIPHQTICDISATGGLIL